jgi:hypothetical protein
MTRTWAFLLPCFRYSRIGAADNGMAPHAAEFRAIASAKCIVVMIAARIREGKVQRIDHTLIIDLCVLFRFKGNGPSTVRASN